MLYLIGTGLGNKKSISLEGLEAIKNCKKVYLENYTSKLGSKNFDFEFIEVNREFVEGFNVEEAK
ncbi:MAG: diphthine synthase, partial [Nanoarchaeota archaeon]|nr:diphthine synthase [Nanoarchaeota archaeon]